MKKHRPRSKGKYVERCVHNKYKDKGIPSRLMPGSGINGNRNGEAFPLGGDLFIKLDEKTFLRGEIKSRKNGQNWTVISRWLGNNDLLYLHQSHGETLVVMRIETHLDILQRSIPTINSNSNVQKDEDNQLL